MLTIAIDRLRKKAVHISEVNRGRWADAECAECGDNLVARKGDQRRHHFAHVSDSDCLGEGNLHKYAKQLIAKEKKLKLRYYPETQRPRILRFDSATVEARKGKFRIDCLLEREDGHELAVEIKVSHSVDELKKAMFEEKELGAVEIDISHLTHRNIEPSVDQIRREVCYTPENVEWLYNERHESHNKKRFQQIKERYGVDLRKD